MPTSLKLWSKLLLVLALVLAPAFGEGEFGGEGGCVNLPGACSRTPSGTGVLPGSTPRMRLTVGQIGEGIAFRLPSTMGEAVATIGAAGQPGVPILVEDDMILLTGAELNELRQCGVESLVLNVAGVDGFLQASITFVPGSDQATILVW